MLKLSAISRISLGLVSLTITILIIADYIGLIPNKTKAAIHERQKICESMAIYCTVVAQKEDKDMILTAIMALAERNDDILSAALRMEDDTYLVISGDHKAHWKKAHITRSTPTHVRVPIYSDNELWATLEVAFKALHIGGIRGIWEDNLIRLVLFTIVIGFLGYQYILKKALKVLDPSKVVPTRVKMAFDSLTEALVLLDTNMRIVHVNNMFTEKLNKVSSDLLGSDINSLGWYVPKSKLPTYQYPWIRALKEKKTITGVRVFLPVKNNKVLLFSVNSTPIMDNSGKCQGAIASFDDLTKVEKKNQQLQFMLAELKKTQAYIRRQNKELEILATHDPLTDCLNRRSFFKKLNDDMSVAIRHRHNVSCVMFDIDHFKSINDNYGHATGDLVLKDSSAIIRSLLRKGDYIGRYGGEEFCIILLHTDDDGALIVAERFRVALESHDFSGVQITASFGLSSMTHGVEDSSTLIDMADQALYKAKNGGRNRVISWSQFNKSYSGTKRNPNQDEQPPAKAADIVSKSLADSAQSSKSMGMHASYDSKGSPSVRIDHKK